MLPTVSRHLRAPATRFDSGSSYVALALSLTKKNPKEIHKQIRDWKLTADAWVDPVGRLLNGKVAGVHTQVRALIMEESGNIFRVGIFS